MPKIKLTAFENASIIRKFTVYYLLMSILPVVVLFYFYIEVKADGQLSITEDNFFWILIAVLAGVITGYIAMRGILKGLIDVTTANKETLKMVLGPDRIRELSSDNDEIAVLARTFSEITTRLEENIRNLEIAKKTLHSVLTKVGHGISSMQNIDNFLDLIVETVTESLSAKTGVLLILDKMNNELVVQSVYGADVDKKNARFNVDEVPFGSVIKSRHSMIVPKVMGEDQSRYAKEYTVLFQYPMICAPLLLHDKALGVIVVSGKRNYDNFQDEEVNLLFNIALQTAVAMENSQLNKDAEKTYFETISALALAVEAKDPYSRGHLERVARYAMLIGQKLNLSPHEIDILRDAAKLHDVGKIGITDDILTKPGTLNEHEWDMMKKHPEIGEGIVKPIQSLRELCDLIRHHHEKLDGTGYPDGLRGEQITLLTRILSVADIYDALTSERPYRTAFNRIEAFDEMRKMDNHIDLSIVKALMDSL